MESMRVANIKQIIVCITDYVSSDHLSSTNIKLCGLKI